MITHALAACISTASARYGVSRSEIRSTISKAVGKHGVGVMGIPSPWLGILAAEGFPAERVEHQSCSNVKAGAFIIAMTERSRAATRYHVPARLMSAAALAGAIYHVPLADIAKIINKPHGENEVGPMGVPVAWLGVMASYGFNPWLVTHSPSEGVVAGTWVLAIERLGVATPENVQVASTRPPAWFLDEAIPLAHRYKVPVALVTAVAAQESGFRPRVVSSAGAIGLMQLMPGTARRFHVSNPLDPRQSLAGGIAYLASLSARFHGDIPLILAGYNAGAHAVIRYGGKIPPFAETEAYVPAVIGRFHYYQHHIRLADRHARPASTVKGQK